jgi:predicted regulator of Ras-like GTPase activity (Roadblock/LC7/MglB family)
MLQSITSLRTVSPEVVLAAIIGGDGEVEAFSGQVEDLEGVVGPVSTTLSTLAARAVQELGSGGLQSIILEGTMGHVIARELGGGRTLVAVASSNARLGLLLDDVRACASEVNRG